MKAVIFDLDGTLIDSNIDFKKMKSSIIRFLETSGVETRLLSDTMLNYEIEKQTKEYLRRKGVRADELSRIFTKVGEIMNGIELEALESVKLIDGVVETLEQLKQLGLKLGIITRGCREYVDRVLEKLRLEAYIDGVAARDSVSKPKPDPEHPRYLLKILGVETSEALLVGNHQMDALCAENAGIKYYLIPREDFHDRNHTTLRNIRDLVHIVAEKSR